VYYYKILIFIKQAKERNIEYAYVNCVLLSYSLLLLNKFNKFVCEVV
jgi:hypothetical protein